MSEPISATTPTLAEQLTQLGFSRVDGLVATQAWNPDEKYRIAARIGEKEKWDFNNGVLAVNLANGQVWITLSQQGMHTFHDIRDRFCRKGKGCFVPLSNGELMNWREIEEKRANPEYRTPGLPD